MSEEREHLFRGKRKDGGGWREGYYAKVGELDIIIGFDGQYHGIVSETLGEYTGLTDKNGTRIFEGDILRNNEGLVGRVTYIPEHCAFMIYIPKENRYCYLWDNDFTKIQVIGNIHDNPELCERERIK